MAGVTFDGVSKIYPDGTRAVNEIDLEIERRRVHGARRPVGLRQDDRAADGRRARGDLRGRAPDRRARRQPRARRATATSRWSSRATRSTRTCPSTRTSRSGCELKKVPKDEIDRRVQRRGADPRPRAVPEAQAARALRRPAPARRDGARDRAPAAGVPDGRAALEPRREAARADARGDRAAPARPRRDDDLRHARPGRGDDDGRPRRRHAQGRAAAGRRPAGALRPAGQPLRRRLHRQPGDEHARGDARAANGGARGEARRRSGSRSTPRRSRARPALERLRGPRR